MPKLPMDYSKTIIYKIEHIDDDSLVYVGHTTNWDKRKCKHKFNCYAEKSGHYNLKLYQMIRENGGWEKFRMIEVEKYPCNDKREAEKRECEVMKELKATMNSMKSYLSDEEKKERQKQYYELHKNNQNKYSKEYRKNNIENFKNREKKYREINKDKIKEYRDRNKQKMKE